MKQNRFNGAILFASSDARFVLLCFWDLTRFQNLAGWTYNGHWVMKMLVQVAHLLFLVGMSIAVEWWLLWFYQSSHKKKLVKIMEDGKYIIACDFMSWKVSWYFNILWVQIIGKWGWKYISVWWANPEYLCYNAWMDTMHAHLVMSTRYDAKRALQHMEKHVEVHKCNHAPYNDRTV